MLRIDALWLCTQPMDTAADGHNTLAMLVRREGETFSALLRRLGRAIARYYDTGDSTDEINPPGG